MMLLTLLITFTAAIAATHFTASSRSAWQWRLGLAFILTATVPAFALSALSRARIESSFFANTVSSLTILAAFVLFSLVARPLAARITRSFQSTSIRFNQQSSQYEMCGALIGEPKPRSISSLFVVVLVVATVGLPLVNASLMPQFAWDGWEYWALRAKTLYSSAGLVDHVRAFTELYPPLVSNQMVVGYHLNSASNWLGNGIVFAMMPFGGWLCAACSLRENGVPKWFSYLLATAAFLGLPSLQVHLALIGYADLSLSILVMIAVLSATRALRFGSAADATTFLVLCIALPFFKVPGLLWAGLLLGAFTLTVVTPIRSKVLWLGMAAVAVLATAFVLFEAKRRGYAYSLYGISQAPNLDWSPLGMPHVFSTFNLILVVLVASVLFGAITGTKAAKCLSRSFGVCFVLLAIATFVFIVTFTNTLEYWADSATLGRALLHVAPAFAMLSLYTAATTSQDN